MHVSTATLDSVTQPIHPFTTNSPLHPASKCRGYIWCLASVPSSGASDASHCFLLAPGSWLPAPGICRASSAMYRVHTPQHGSASSTDTSITVDIWPSHTTNHGTQFPPSARTTTTSMTMPYLLLMQLLRGPALPIDRCLPTNNTWALFSERL